MTRVLVVDDEPALRDTLGYALRQEGFDVESLDLVQPTLDDVFVQKTGQHLEGAEKHDTEETGAVTD